MKELDRLQQLLATSNANAETSELLSAVSRGEQQPQLVATDVSPDSPVADENNEDALPFEQVMSLLQSLAYPGEFQDRELLETRYNLNTYLDAISHKKDYADESLLKQALNESSHILPQFMPHIYEIAQTVLQNLQIDFNEIAGGGIEVRLLPASIRNAFVKVASTEQGLSFSFIISRSYLTGYTDEEIAYCWGIRLYEALFDAERYANLVTQDDDGNAIPLLPTYAELIRKRMYFESLISMDRIGLVACGSLKAAQTCLIKDCNNGELGEGWLQIPSDDELDELAERVNLDANHLMSELDFIPTRLRCMRQYCSTFLSNPTDEAKGQVDADVAKLFENFMPSPDSEEDIHLANLVASVGMDMITQDGEARDSEIRILLEELLNWVTPPSDAICTDALERASRKRKAIKFLQEAGVPNALLDALSRIAINSDCHFDANNALLVKVLKQLGIDEPAALHHLTEAYKNAKCDVDPLMDDQVACARAILEGTSSEGTSKPKARELHATTANWKEMPLVEKIRYSGDLEAVETLGNVYHLNSMIKQSETVKEHFVTSDLHEEYLNHLHLSPEISPRVCNIVEHVRKVLGYSGDLEVFCEKPGNGLNACAWIDVAKDGRRGIININPEAIETFDDDELAYLIGHEMGHLIYQHGQWGFVVKSLEDKTTMLPFMGDRLYWEWNQKCEISADRAGAVAAGNAEAALRAQLKVCYGLSFKNLDVNADVLLSQLKVVQDAEELEGSARWAKELSHPIVPLRINALKAFCDIYYAKGCGASGLKPKHLEQVDNKIAESYELLRRYPRTKTREAAMRLVALYGLKIINSDGKIEDRELSELLKILMSEHTDRPLDELIGESKARDKAITAATEVLADCDDDDLKRFTMLQLAYLALIDGTISSVDRDMLCNVASLIDLGEFDVDSILQTAAEIHEKFPVDFLLEDEVKKVQAMLEEVRK